MTGPERSSPAARTVVLAADLADALRRMARRAGLKLQPFVHLALQEYVTTHANPDGTPRYDAHDEAGNELPRA